jgi:NADPH-dependent glutamate synthase beta subunit-like oxidoreductase
MPVSGSEFTATFDAVIQAIGEEPDDALLPADLRKKKAKNGCH